MATWLKVALIFLNIYGILTTIECSSEGNCAEKIITQCRDEFNENTSSLCVEVIELKECLMTQTDCDKSQNPGLQYMYRVLSYRLHVHAACINGGKAKKRCNESLARSCYQQFNANSTKICREAKRLRRCIDQLEGCHEMKHPSYTLSISVLNKHRRCFFVNYSKILEVLEKKTKKARVPEIQIQTNTSAKTETEEQSSDILPYTFVVVATVCTCLFLVILVVFSVVRHTSVLRRQRHSTVERPPISLVVNPCRPSSSHRTRRHFRRGRRNRRRHMYVIHEARQTVSGFFEGNVPPPPYSAVLDDTESLRAGDRPPPYQPPAHISIGVIV